MILGEALEADPELQDMFSLAEALGCPMWMIKMESLEDFYLWGAHFLRKKEKK